jgi:hypothetical protein
MNLPADLLAFLAATYPPGQQALAAHLLSQARIEDGSAPSIRVLRCAAFAGRGRLHQLERCVALIASDWRDVIMAGEYERRDGEPVRVRDLDRPFASDCTPASP